MISSIGSRCLLRQLFLSRGHRLGTRNILSASYACDDEWNKRLQDPILSKVSPDSFFAEVSQRYIKKLKVGAVDIDIFANIVDHESQLEELEHLLFNLRKTRRTRQTLESTHHAVCRAFIQFGGKERLLSLIQKRWEYGVFPDHYCYNLMMSQFLTEGKVKEAAQTGTTFSLQEDFQNHLTNILSAYSIMQYVASDPQVAWSEEVAEVEEEEEVDEDEQQYERIPVIRNPWMDGHFDLKDGDALCGRALLLISPHLENRLLATQLEMMGHILLHQWKEASSLLQKNGSQLTPGFIFLVNQWNLKQEEAKKVKAQPEEGEGEGEKKDAEPQEEEAKGSVEVEVEEEEEPERVELFASLNKLPSTQPPSGSSFIDVLRQEVDRIRIQQEPKDRETLIQAMKTWEGERKIALKRQLDDLMRDQRIKEIVSKRESLIQRERLLFFFENLNSHELKLAEAEAKLAELKYQHQVEEEYIPPKVR